MMDTLAQDVEEMYKGRAFLTPEEVSQLLSCDEKVVYNWIKRADPKRRPPRIVVGKSLRFPKREFIRWLGTELNLGL
jgi:predicted DNA-binding transcriptional regulator AlpA